VQLDALTLRDGLTGLCTHRAFQERLREECARALRYGQPMSLMIADIDGFASVNYDLGYQVGDDILRRIALVLQEDESADRPRGSDIVARYSGEEFVLLMPETGKAGALTKAARRRVAARRCRRPRGPADRRRGRGARRQARRPWPRPLLLGRRRPIDGALGESPVHPAAPA